MSKKIDITYIRNSLKRKMTFRKRRKGLLKKISEISTLCAIDACAVIYTPDKPDQKPDVWPSEEGVRNVISRFRAVSEQEQSKKMMSQESFLRNDLIKSQEQLKKLKDQNRKKEMFLLMYEYFTFGNNNLENANTVDLNDDIFFTDQELEEMRKTMEMHQDQGPETNGDGMLTSEDVNN